VTLTPHSIGFGVAAVAAILMANGVAPEGSNWQAFFTGMWISCALGFYRMTRP
jgi:hypothetical protein